MAEITLKLRHNTRSGQRELVIHFESDDDAMAHEHERDHRALIESMLGLPLDAIADTIVVERLAVGAAEASEVDTQNRATQTLSET